jgi:6,7-dimethyl-8-ribityllumazine synthase
VVTKNIMGKNLKIHGQETKVGKNNRAYNIEIVVSRFNELITKDLLVGAISGLNEFGITVTDKKIHLVPGAFEIPFMVSCLCKKIKQRNIDGIITLGCLIKGDTAHFEYISGPVSNTLCDLSAKFNIPIGFGILTCYTKQQALKRSSIKKIKTNKGYEAAISVIEAIDCYKMI